MEKTSQLLGCSIQMHGQFLELTRSMKRTHVRMHCIFGMCRFRVVLRVLLTGEALQGRSSFGSPLRILRIFFAHRRRPSDSPPTYL